MSESSRSIVGRVDTEQVHDLIPFHSMLSRKRKKKKEKKRPVKMPLIHH